MKREHIDHYLQHKNRTLRTLPGKLLLGATGARLFADYLDPVPGFSGRIDFIHKMNLPGIFTTECEGISNVLEPLEAVWYPSHLFIKYESSRIEFEEQKFITWKDYAVSCQRWTNKTSFEKKIKFSISEAWSWEREDGCINIYRDCENHKLKLIGTVCSDNGIHRDGYVNLPANSSIEFTIIAAIGESETDCFKDKNLEVKNYIRDNRDENSYVEKQKSEYDSWFSEVPVFSSDDALLNKTWWYRWFLLRHNYAEPSCGNFKHGTFYEGRSHKTSKELYQSKGHEFTQLIPLSTPLHITDCKWRNHKKECEEAILSLLDCADEDGIFCTMMLDRFGVAYGNYSEWAIYQYYLIHQDIEFMKKILPGFKKNVRSVWEKSKNNMDNLPICYNHRRTGKEYQPSYWYFNDYPDNAKEEGSYTYLKRVDLAIYLYLNALGTAKLCDEIKDSDAAEFYQLAENIKREVLSKMWDKESNFFYDLHYETEEMALVKNVVGIYPMWAEITNDSHLKLLDYYFSEDSFAVGSAFASVSKDCPVFMPQGSWKGDFFKGRNGCMWDGPSWPYTTCIALDAIAKQSKLQDHKYDKEFAKYLKEYSLEHYRNHNLEEPYLVEHYDSVTGEMLSNEVDYLHSYYIDLIIRHVAGIEPTENGIKIDPIDIGLQFFSLSQVQLNGHELCVEYQKSEYYKVTMDKKVVFCAAELAKGEINYSEM